LWFYVCQLPRVKTRYFSGQTWSAVRARIEHVRSPILSSAVGYLFTCET